MPRRTVPPPGQAGGRAARGRSAEPPRKTTPRVDGHREACPTPPPIVGTNAGPQWCRRPSRRLLRDTATPNRRATHRCRACPPHSPESTTDPWRGAPSRAPNCRRLARGPTSATPGRASPDGMRTRGPQSPPPQESNERTLGRRVRTAYQPGSGDGLASATPGRSESPCVAGQGPAAGPPQTDTRPCPVDVPRGTNAPRETTVSVHARSGSCLEPTLNGATGSRPRSRHGLTAGAAPTTIPSRHHPTPSLPPRDAPSRLQPPSTSPDVDVRTTERVVWRPFRPQSTARRPDSG